MTEQMWLNSSHLEEEDPSFKGILADSLRKIPLSLGTFALVSYFAILPTDHLIIKRHERAR